jgi:hypothetical protein
VAVLVEPLTIAEKALLQIDKVQQRLPWALVRAGQAPPSVPPGGRHRRRPGFRMITSVSTSIGALRPDTPVNTKHSLLQASRLYSLAATPEPFD